MIRWRPAPRIRTLLLSVVLALGIGLAAIGPTRVHATNPEQGGVTLDLYGGLHPFGGFNLNAGGTPYWPGWDIARAVAVLPDGSGGWTLDGWGGIHAWGSAPPIATPAYWPGWDIARALVVLPDEQSGYVMDGWGGLHAFGSAPPLSGPYWPGWDVASGFDVALNGSNQVIGGWTLDAWGGLHPVGSPPALNSPAGYYPGHNIWQRFHYTALGAYAVGHWGIVAPGAGVSPNWSGYSDWGSWDAVRDIVLANPTQSPAMSQPVSADASVQSHFALTASGVAARPECGVPASAVRAGKVILVSLGCQQLSAYQDGTLVANTLITTGRPALPTLRGWTSIMGRNHPFLMVSPWPRGSIYYYNPSVVQYVVWFRAGGYGIHDAYWEPNSALGPGSENSGYASHGCIHVPLGYAQFMYAWADTGTPVGVF
jgi:hypothetical protein